jgi:hypothetical protein
MQEDDGSCMIGCELCEEWFHKRCVGQIDMDKVFVCNRCTRGDGNLFISQQELSSYQTRTTNWSSLVVRKNYSSYSMLSNRALPKTNHGRTTRLEMQHDVKPWTVACLQKHPLFVLGDSSGAISTYSITSQADFTQGYTIPDFINGDDGQYVGVERKSYTTTGHSYGLSYVYLPPSEDCVISSNWQDGLLIVRIIPQC